MPSNRRNIRKKRAVDEDDDEEAGDEGAQALSAIEETRRQQEFRRRMPGVSTEALAAGVQQKSEAGAVGDDVHGNFLTAKQATNALDTSKRMAEFVEQQVAQRLGKRVAESEQDLVEAKRAREEEELYHVPDNLKAQEQKEVVIPGFNTVITEVQLSAQHKMQNIEETEAAKKRILDSSGTDMLAPEYLSKGGGRYDHDSSKRNSVRRGLFAITFGRHQPKRKEEMDIPKVHLRAPRISNPRLGPPPRSSASKPGSG